ncbi:hypothetical protein JM18_003535 [Phytophthora kernoviae]|uniref:Uncharacterized protein n=2 Tax=Phytophthora kernoviae TaxID=325452 RepID=A0A921V7M6_9STRA|nr:hypothetical protein G195_004780 [Phytophthora kernoviae 00238/432]KAG2523906.1 hypothetical protein JM18_003535 [Phytophthora kernoviae]
MHSRSSSPRRTASPPPNESDIIDVVSHGPVIIETRGLRALTLDGSDSQGRFEDDDTQTPCNNEDEQEADNGDARSFRYRSSGGILQRITLRRRKEGEQDVFWTAILVLTLLSFALMSVLTIYLSQTDFFASHQNDLFGTTVDNRFTVVAEDDAQILLKSGYSTSVYAEAMIAFDSGELQIGRRGLASAETQDFYGVSFFPNGTAAFTNRIDSPMIEAEYLHAKKAVVFDDGTVMTTAANSSGGVKELGDLNLVSQSGAVVTSAGGKPLLFVDPEGTVTVANTESDDPTLSGITLDGTHGSATESDSLKYGSVTINTGLDQAASSLTEIGSHISEISLMGKSLVMDAVDTLGIGGEVESVTIGSESVGEVNMQGGAVSLTGAATVNGVSLLVQSKKINIGSNTTNDITIGASSVKTAALEADSVLVGSQAKTVSVGVGSSTVNIGSDASVINLSGRKHASAASATSFTPSLRAKAFRRTVPDSKLTMAQLP